MGARRDRAVRDQIAYDKARRKRLVLNDKIISDVARRIVTIVGSKYDHRLVVDCKESALIALSSDGAIPSKGASRKERREFVVMALDDLIRRQVITTPTGRFGEFIIETVPTCEIPTQRQGGLDWDEDDGRALSPDIIARIKRWDQKGRRRKAA
jgi:hypothetical protein